MNAVACRHPGQRREACRWHSWRGVVAKDRNAAEKSLRRRPTARGPHYRATLGRDFARPELSLSGLSMGRGRRRSLGVPRAGVSQRPRLRRAEHNCGHRGCGLGHVLVLPEPQDAPAMVLKGGRVASVTRPIGLNFLGPIRSVGARTRPVLGATVPPASIHVHDDALACETPHPGAAADYLQAESESQLGTAVLRGVARTEAGAQASCPAADWPA